MTIFLACNTFASIENHDGGYDSSGSLRISKEGYINYLYPTPVLEGWARWGMYPFTNSSYTSATCFQMLSASGQKLFTIQGRSGSLAELKKFTTSTANATVGDAISLPNNFVILDVNWKINPVDGFVRVYFDNILVSSFEGDTSVFGVGVSKIQMGSTNSLQTSSVSNFVIADEDTRGMLVKTIKPNAAGSLSQMVGTFSDVNTPARSDATGITSETAGQTQLFNLTDPETGNSIVKAVFANMRASRGETGPQNMNPVMRIGAVDFHKPNLTMTVAPEYKSALWYLNPATGLTFTRAELVALQVGVRSQA
jgi:hypothetical protein